MALPSALGRTSDARHPPLWLLLVAGSILMMASGGVRATFGLYLEPVIDSLDSNRSMYGLAIAIQSIVWGAGQPLAGAAADRFGSARVLGIGGIIYAVAMFAMGGANNALALQASAGFLAGAGMAAASLSLVLASISRMAPAEKRGQALGIATAFGTAGQIGLIPLAQWIIDGQGWRTAAVVMGVLLVVAVVAVPVFRGNAADQTRPEDRSAEALTPLREDLRRASHSLGYKLLNLAFFVCGFHVTFIATHLKSYATDLGQSGSVAAWALVLIGLFNMGGSYAAGVLGDRHSKTRLLALVYGLRGVVIAAFVLVPPSATVTLVFGASIGLLWLTTVPLTSGIIAQQFGTDNAGALFGIVFFSHQIGAFIGAWLGGWLADTTGSYDVAWVVAIVLAVMAAAIHLVLDDGPVGDPPAGSGLVGAPAAGFLVVAFVGIGSALATSSSEVPNTDVSASALGQAAGSGTVVDLVGFCALHPIILE